MRLKIDIYIAASIAFAIITLVAFWTFSSLLAESSIFYLGVPFSLSIFFFLLTVLHRDAQQWVFKIARSKISDIVLYTLTILSILIILIVPAYEGSMLEWMKIPPLNWLRYLFALLLTNFLPGYFLLKILDRKHVITGSIVIVLSYLLSLFITFLAGFFILLSSNPLETLGSQIIITINIALIIIHYFTNHEKTRNYLLTVDWTEVGLILSVLAVITVGSLLVMSNNMPLTSGDMMRHYGNALDLSNGFPVYGGKMVIYEGGYLFATYLNVLFVLSGIPPAIAEQGLYVLSFIPLLAFYSAIKVWFSEKLDKRLPLIATMLSILLGFGGLYALYLKFADPTYISITQLLSTATSKTYDIYMRILYLPDIVAPIWNIGLPIFFTLLYFLKKESYLLTKATIVSILVILGYLAHPSEIFFFCFILFIYVLFLRRKSEEKIGPYILLGLTIVAIVDFAAPAQIYVLSDAGTVISLPFVVSLILAALASVAELVKDKGAFLFLMELRIFLMEKLGKSWRYGRWVLIYIYVFFFVLWLTVLKDYNLWDWGGYTFTPFFVLPTRLGAVGLLAIISIAIYFSKIIKNRTLLFFLLLIPMGFIFEQAANYYQLYYPAYRFGTITFVGACVIAAYGIINGINKIRSPKRKMVTGVLLGFLMISGMLSTSLFYVNASFYSVNSNISQDELDALDYIRQNTPANASVLTLNTTSANNLRNFAGLNGVQDAQRWSQLLSASNPYIITYILSSSNIKYIYVTQKDAELLSEVQLNSFLKYFPKVFKNDYATIYEVPHLTAPSPEASFAVLHFSPSLQSLEDSQQPFSQDDVLPALFASLLNSRYTVLYVDNVLMENIGNYLSHYTNILLASDPSFPIESLLKWVSAGNTLTVFNTHGNGFFANLLGINNSSPLLSIKNFNSGKILYVNSKVDVGKESKIIQTEFLDEFKNLLSLKESTQRVDVLPVYNSASGNIQVKGDLNIDTDVLMLQGAINLTNSPFSINESTKIKIYGKIDLTIKNATLLISPSESYMLIKPDNYTIKGEIFVNASEGSLIISDGNAIYNSNASISFHFTSTGTTLYTRLPSINVSGTSIFDQLDVHAALYVPLAGIIQQKAEIQGNVKFDTLYISNPITIFSMFQAEGRILNLAETTAQPTISWAEMLSSPYNIVFNAFFLLSIAIYLIKKRKAKTAINKEIR